jgi:hypothetical protein
MSADFTDCDAEFLDELNDILQAAIGDGEGRIYARDVVRHLQRHGYIVAKFGYAPHGQYTAQLELTPPLGLYRVRDKDRKVICTVETEDLATRIVAALNA